MPKTTQVDHLHRLVFECVHCGRHQEKVMHEGHKIEIGTIITPYPGDYSWGRCLFCHKPGLRAITEPPPKTKGPVGWNLLSSDQQSSSKTEKP
jgi:hypothetical protein